ncbi:RNA 3'-terminal phosphate cyclase isoform X3 [Rhipicephalus microplus]|uniref:RNA 3'-terminal phosphate cyclase isoform X3 n=1 Tax=Rhipicephalus microplus TaxID=6941 RepID=UPI003F6B58D5
MSGEASEKLLTVDGSVMEGGGQVLRMAVAFSALFRKPVHVTNIRAGRSNPGLRPQHLTGINLVRDICGGRLVNAVIGSTEIELYPGPIRGGVFSADTGTAGSVVLLLQAALPCLLFADAPSVLRLRGGTNAEMAPQIDYTISVFLPVARKFGASCDIKVIKRGYYPKGGGLVEVCAQPLAGVLQPLVLTEPGRVVRVTGRSFVAGQLPLKVAHMMADRAVDILREQLLSSVPVSVERLKEPEEKAFGTGNGIILVAESSTGMKLAGSALGKRGVMAEAVGQAAAEELCQELKHNVCVDKHLQDQLIVLMALANGTSRILCGPLTSHTETAIYVAHLLTQPSSVCSQDSGCRVCSVNHDGLSQSSFHTYARCLIHLEVVLHFALR